MLDKKYFSRIVLLVLSLPLVIADVVIIFAWFQYIYKIVPKNTEHLVLVGTIKVYASAYPIAVIGIFIVALLLFFTMAVQKNKNIANSCAWLACCLLILCLLYALTFMPLLVSSYATYLLYLIAVLYVISIVFATVYYCRIFIRLKLYMRVLLVVQYTLILALPFALIYTIAGAGLSTHYL